MKPALLLFMPKLVLALLPLLVAGQCSRNGLPSPATPERTIAMDTGVYDLALSADGTKVVTARGMRTTPEVSLLDLGNGKTQSLALSDGDRVDSLRVAMSPDLAYVGVGTWRGVRIIDLRRKASVRTVPIPGSHVTALVFSRDSQFLYAGARAVHQVNLRTAEVKDVFSESQGSLRSDPRIDPEISALAISPDGRILAIGVLRGVVLWDLASAKQRHALPSDGVPGDRVDFSPDGKLLAAGGDSVDIWNCQTGKKLATLSRAPEFKHYATLAFSPDQKFLVAAGTIGRGCGSGLVVWRLLDGAHVATVFCHRDIVTQIAFLPGAHKVITGSQDKTLQIWDLDKYLPEDKELSRGMPTSKGR